MMRYKILASIFKIWLVVLIGCLQPVKAVAGPDMWSYLTMRFDNLYFTFSTEEDSTQNYIAMDMIKDLVKRSGYKKHIHVEFLDDTPEPSKYPYALSCVSNKYLWKGVDFYGIALTVYHRTIKPKEILNILYYAIKNEAYIRQKQDTIEKGTYEGNVRLSIPISEIVANASRTSPLVDSICSKRFYAPDYHGEDYKLSYFYQDSLFHFFNNSYSAGEQILFSLDNFQSLISFKDYQSCIFLSDTTFFYVYEGSRSKNNVIKGFYRPPASFNFNRFPTRRRQVTKVSWDKMAITYSSYPDRTAYYYVREDRLVQNIEAIREIKVKESSERIMWVLIGSGAIIIALLSALAYKQKQINKLKKQKNPPF